jgi:hypothetical protein
MWTLYHLALDGTDVSENISPPSLGFLRVIGFHSYVTMEPLLISLSIEEYYIGSKNTVFGVFSRKYQLYMSSGTLYHVALVRTNISENILPPSAGFLGVIAFHSCVTMESLLISFSIDSVLRRYIVLLYGEANEQCSMVTQCSRSYMVFLYGEANEQ